MNLRAYVRLFCLVLFLSIAFSVSASAATVRPSAATLPFPGAYPTIQATIDAAQSGDTVLVADGTYSGPGNRDLDYYGKNLTVKSVNGATKTIIDCGGYASTDGSGDHRGFYLHSGETANAIISGLTIRNGYAPVSPSENFPTKDGGGILCISCSPAISDCIITDNIALHVGGGICVSYGNAKITNCVLQNNSASAGGGMLDFNSSSTVLNCQFISNVATNGFAGGLYEVFSTSIVENSLFRGNSALLGFGGGMWARFGSSPNVINCTFTENSATYGGGFGADRDCSPKLTNCILWNDKATTSANEVYILDAASSTITLKSTDIQGGYASPGNIDADPMFANAPAGDLHLKLGSPCLGKGTANGVSTTDLDGRTRPNPPSMGAYELGETLNVPSQYPTIQAGIDAARPDDTVLVADGTYTGDGNRDIDFKGKNVTVKSVNGAAKTVIDCGGYASVDGSGNHRGFYIHSGETSAMIDSFTVKNGYQTYVSNIANSANGGGICVDGSSVIIQNCIVTGNTVLGSGGGVCNVNGGNNGIIRNCTITNNMASSGGGVSNYNGGGSITLANCTVSDNTATGNGGGGGIYNSNNAGNTISVTNCAVSNNTTYGSGGGVCDLNNGDGSIAVTNCNISRNTASLGGGGVLNQTFNTNGISDGGIISLTNCSITSNKTNSNGSGILDDISRGGSINLTNNVVFADIGGVEVKNYAYSTSDAIVSYCDIQSGYPGTGNIDADPKFVNAATGDLHLKPGSPCLGAGTATGAPATDKDGNPRPNPPSMGAYELGVLPAAITGFTLSPNHLDVPGPNVFADVPVTGSFKSVSLTFAPGSFSGPTPSFKLNESSGHWTTSFPTTFLKLARANPLTLIATGVRPDGSTDQRTATLQAGQPMPLPSLSLAFNIVDGKTTAKRNESVTFVGTVNNLTATNAFLTKLEIPMPSGFNYVPDSSTGLTYDSVKNTLIWVGALLPQTILAAPPHSFSFTAQVAASTPKGTTLSVLATLSCEGFQTVTKNWDVQVDAGLIPLSIEVIGDGSGLLDGAAVIESLPGITPLLATLTPIPDRPDVFLGTRRFSMWFDIKTTTKTSGVGDIQPSGSVTQQILASAKLIAPSVSPEYQTTFSNVDDAVTMTVAFNGRAFAATTVDLILTAFNPTGFNLDDVAATLDDFLKVPAFIKVQKDLTPMPRTAAQWAWADAHINYDLTIGLSYADVIAVELILRKQYGKSFTDADIFKGLKRIFSVIALSKVAGDAIYLGRNVNFGDAAMTLRFVASSGAIKK